MTKRSGIRSRSAFSDRLDKVRFFFPLQLLVLHFKKDLLLMAAWGVLFGYITGGLGVKYGIPNLFLYPEYFGTVSFWSYALVGFSVGGFITGFNLYSYTLHAYRFPFLATLSRPFQKFTLNNGIVPTLFILTYLIFSARFQRYNELLPVPDILLHLLGFLCGVGLFLLLAIAYFMRTNTDIRKLLGREPEMAKSAPVDIRGPEATEGREEARLEQQQQLRLATRWLRREQRMRKWRVDLYLTPPLKLTLARSIDHYDKELMRRVLWQNHINGSIFEVLIVISFLTLGAFSDLPLFEIPAAASVFLLFTMVIMVLSAFYSWFKGWTVTFLAGLVLLLNMGSNYTQRFLSDNSAYGMDYGAPHAPYTIERVTELAFDDSATAASKAAMERTLEAWKQRNAPLMADGGKPPFVILTTSGGGLRAMLWTFRSMQILDSLIGGDLMDRTALITGSSGGLIGAAYYRQLAWLAEKGDPVDLRSQGYLEDMSSDMLNPVAFSFVTNDLFIRYRRITDGKYIYTRDRGYAFERRLNEMTNGVLDVRLADLQGPESRAEMPTLIVSPTTINDGRRLLISASPVAFVADSRPLQDLGMAPSPESMDMVRFFPENDPMQLKFTSALRMSSTFPYITPVVTMPSEPPMRVMDAGIRDNYGYRVYLQYLLTMREWLKENTSGIVVMQMRDKQKELEVQPVGGSIMGRLLDPARNVVNNIVRVQDQDYDLMVEQASGWLDMPMRIVDIELQHIEDEAISLSWHLTAVEKKHVLRTVQNGTNTQRLHLLKDLLQGVEPISAPGDGAPPAGARAPAVLR